MKTYKTTNTKHYLENCFYLLLLYKVDFDNYDGMIGAINVGHNHWKFLVSIPDFY